MRLRFTLFQFGLERLDGDDVPHPRLGGEVAVPDDGWMVYAQTRRLPSGRGVVDVLWAESPDWQEEEAWLAAAGPGDPVYVGVQPGLAVDREGAGTFFDVEEGVGLRRVTSGAGG